MKRYAIKMSATTFINYRRDDTGGEAKLIADALNEELGGDHAFLDSTSVAFGTEWPSRIQEALEAAKYVFVVIGPDWLRAGSDEWGMRRIDDESDWVRREIAYALNNKSKIIIPVLVRGGVMPPPKALPSEISEIPSKQAIELRRNYWDHDIKLLTAQVHLQARSAVKSGIQRSPYPEIFPVGPDPFNDSKLREILKGELTTWQQVISPLPEDGSKVKTELYREFKFATFRDAVSFMSQLAPGCDIANHHPRWENIWKTLRVFLTTWDIEHKISDRDIQLARYFDRAYEEFPGSNP